VATDLYLPVDPPLPVASPRGLLEVARITRRIVDGTLSAAPEVVDVRAFLDGGQTLTAAAIHDKLDGLYGQRAVTAAIDQLLDTDTIRRTTTEPSRQGVTVDALTAAAYPIAGSGGPNWARGGVAFEAEACGTSEVYEICDTPTTTTAPTGGGTVEADAFTVRVGARCSAMGDVDDATRAKALRLLDVWQHAAIASEFWRGDHAQAESLDRPYLADGDAQSVGTGLSALDGLAALESALAGVEPNIECGAGQRGMIHASPETVTVWAALGLVRPEGGLLLTALDTVIVTGPGYDGSGDDGTVPTTAAHTAYATGFVDVRLTAPMVTPTLDRATNTRVAWAERTAVVTYGPCCVASAGITISDRS
jgi:hypothetical protein